MLVQLLAPLLLLNPCFQGEEVEQTATEQTSPAQATTVENGDLHIPNAAAGLDLVIPQKERLAFYVQVDLAIVGKIRAGSFVITSRVEPFRTGLPRPGEKADPDAKKQGYIQAKAAGGAAGYKLDHLIDARILPQEWPRVQVRDYQSGTENRRREVKYGSRNGEPMSWYRRDSHCDGCERHEHFVKAIIGRKKHCNGCKRGQHRDWDAPKVQAIPAGALDMISAIFLARELVRTETERVEFPLLDKYTWWDLVMVLGEKADVTVPAGTFACRAVKLDPKTPPNGEKGKEFKGLFGIHGTLSIWLHETTGVPVMIEGIVPLGPLDLDVAIQLAEFQDTPEGFAPVEN